MSKETSTIFWTKFREKQPTKEGQYLVSYDTLSWRGAIWEKGKWLGDFDKYGYHTLCDPIWWVDVPLPKLNKGGHLK